MRSPRARVFNLLAARYNKANVCVQDVILGNYWIEVYGEVKIVNKKTGVGGYVGACIGSQVGGWVGQSVRLLGLKVLKPQNPVERLISCSVGTFWPFWIPI